MRWALATIMGLGALIGASTTPVMAAAAPGPAAKSAIPSTSQVENVHRRWGGHRHRGGFGGFGLYVGPSWGGYYGGYGGGYSPYYAYDDDYYYAPRRSYYPRYGYRRHGYRHRHHHRRWR